MHVARLRVVHAWKNKVNPEGHAKTFGVHLIYIKNAESNDMKFYESFVFLVGSFS